MHLRGQEQDTLATAMASYGKDAPATGHVCEERKAIPSRPATRNPLQKP